MGCGGGADMIRDGLWERERKGKGIKRRKKDGNEGDSGGAVKSYLGFKLHRRRSPPHCNLLSIVTNRSEPIDLCQQLSGDGSVNSLSVLRSPDSLSNVHSLLME